MRKNIICLTLLALFGSVCSFAQKGDDGPSSNSKANVIKLGPRIGAAFTTMGQPSETDVYDGLGIGLTLGASLQARLGRATRETRLGGTGLLGFSLQLLYKQNKVKTIGSGDISLGYFEVPLSVRIFPMQRSNVMNSFYVELGPDFALLTSKSPNVLSVPQANVSYHVGDFNGGDVRFLVGTGYTIPKTSLDVNLRYYVGTSKLAGNFPCRMNSFELSLAYMFNIAKF